jgi:PIN domain nuclease of toxin-antitoxin system
MLSFRVAGRKLTPTPFDAAQVLVAAIFGPLTRRLNVSFAARACLATASLARRFVLMANRDWTTCDRGVDIHLI